jgi:hypothetical protein
VAKDYIKGLAVDPLDVARDNQARLIGSATRAYPIEPNFEIAQDQTRKRRKIIRGVARD